MCRQLGYVVGIVFLFCASTMAQSNVGSQKNGPEQDEKGITGYVQFGGSSNASGRVFKLDGSLGYDFNSHFGVDVGVPVYFAHSSTTVGSGASDSGIGNPYADFRLTFRGPSISYRAIVTGYFPVADTKKGFSTGRMTGDWTNRFEASASRLTPFLEVGIGNTIRDSRFFDRPFTSLGFNGHVEGGTTVALVNHVELGGSAYAVLPAGQQTIFSRMPTSMAGGAMAGGAMQHGRVFDNATETVGTADLARDHGFSAWIGAYPGSYIELELGYTRSVSYDLNTVSFNVGVRLNQLLRKQSKH